MNFTGRCQEVTMRYIFAPGLMREILPGVEESSRGYRCGDIAGHPGWELTINLAGEWADRATGEHGGDIVSLFAAQRGITQGQALNTLEKRLRTKRGAHYEVVKAYKSTHRGPKGPKTTGPVVIRRQKSTDTASERSN